MPYATGSFQMTLSDWAKYSMTRTVSQSLCDSWASCSLSYSDFRICNTSSLHRLLFSKLRVFVTWLLSPCYSASLCKISLKLDNQLLSYSQKQFLKWWISAILNYKNFHIWSRDSHPVPNLLVCVPNFIKIGWFIVAISWFDDLQDGSRVPSWTFKI